MYQIISKNRVLRLSENPEFIFISVLSTPTKPNLTAQAWKMASRMTKMQKSVIRSICIYLTRYTSSRSWVEVKGQAHIVRPVFNRCTSFSFHISRTNHSWDMSHSVWPWKNTSEIFKANLAKKEFPKEFLQNLIRWLAWPEGYSYQVL